MNILSKKIVFFVLLFISLNAFAQTQEEMNKMRVKLPNGWSLTPVGKQLHTSDLPLNLIVSHNKKYLAISNNGQSKLQSIELIDLLRARD